MYSIVSMSVFSVPIMENQRKIRVLNASRPYIHVLQAYNFKNFFNLSKPLKIQRIRYAFCVTILILSMLVMIAFGVHHTFMADIGIREFSTSFALLVIYAQIMFFYVVLVMKRNEISDAIDCIQKVTDKRKSLNDS